MAYTQFATNANPADDGASIVAANKEAKKPEKAIDGDDDSYMKNSCSAQKWIIIELSQLPQFCVTSCGQSRPVPGQTLAGSLSKPQKLDRKL
eukprot:1146559-Pelagomonas_calceolata.AAC.6